MIFNEAENSYILLYHIHHMMPNDAFFTWLGMITHIN